MNTTPSYRPLLHAIAVATAMTALLPIVAGALVTTLDAGMAFRDWPTSDGQSMLSYPWLKSAGDKFLEHGHRLAGIAVGCAAILLAVSSWTLERRRWLRWCGVGALAAVVAQGLLGGGRVLADERLYALLHGTLAALVFAFLASVAMFYSRAWTTPERIPPESRIGALKVLVVATPVLILVQYSLGGLVRHLGTALYEHVGMALVVLACILATAIAAYRSGSASLARPAYLLLAIAVGQVSLGGMTWLTKYGLASIGYVAVQRTPLQVAIRTSHTVVGMLVLAAAVVLLLRVMRADAVRGRRRESVERPMVLAVSSGLRGGVS